MTHVLRSALSAKIRTAEGLAEVRRRTGLSRTQVQRIANGAVSETSELNELHAAAGLPPPEASLDARLHRAFSTILGFDDAHAETIVRELERQAAEFQHAAREDEAAAAAKERAARARKAASAPVPPPRDRPH